MAGVLTLLGLALVLLLGAPTFQAELTPEGLHLSAEAQSHGLTLKAGGFWNSEGFFPQLSLTWVPQVSTCTITFTTDFPGGILVRPGQVIKEGDLIGYTSRAAKDRILELEKALVDVEDEVLRAEVLAEIERLRAESEVRALLAGRVLAVEVEQVNQALRVRIQLEKP